MINVQCYFFKDHQHFCYTARMKHLVIYLRRAFVVSGIYLLSIILGGFFILPGIFQVDDYSFPLIVELILKFASVIAVVIVLLSAIVIPGLRFIQKPKQRVKSPIFISATTFLIGLVFILSHGLYVKLRACPVNGSNAWYCQIEGDSYVGMLVLAFFLSCLVGFIAWASQIVRRKQQ